MSQSGAMGVTILDYAYELGLGIHEFVSAGNKADVSANDLLEYWEEDPETRVILMYLENFGNPSKFTRIASRVSRQKPIVLVKSGRTISGARAASSHTGALAGTDVATDALLAQCGVIRVDTVGELFDVARAFEDVPLLEGNRVAIVTNAGGPGIIAADACESQGLEVVELTETTLTALREAFPEEASVRNPVDMIASANPDSYRVALRAILADPNVDAVIAAFVPPLTVSQPEVARAIVDVHQELPEKPLLAVLMGRAGLPEGRAQLQEAGIPAYIFPESAARALAAMNRYREWLERPTGTVARFDVDHDAAAAIIERAATGDGGRLSELDALALFSAYGISTVQSRVARSADEAVAVAEEVGFPVVLKINSEEIGHKTDVGGVVIDVRTEDEVRAAFTEMMESVATAAPAADVDGILVQQFVKGGRETIVGVTHDPLFGPLIMFGLGGIYTEALKDVAFGLHPLSDVDAEEMVRSIRGFSILEGTRGEAPSDLGAIVETLQRVSQLVGDFEQISELDINPLLVFEEGAIAADGLIELATANERKDRRHGMPACA
jgi:acetyltransferase